MDASEAARLGDLNRQVVDEIVIFNDCCIFVALDTHHCAMFAVFTLRYGRFGAVGSYDSRCVFYSRHDIPHH